LLPVALASPVEALAEPPDELGVVDEFVDEDGADDALSEGRVVLMSGLPPLLVELAAGAAVVLVVEPSAADAVPPNSNNTAIATAESSSP